MSVDLREFLNNPGKMFELALTDIFSALGGEALGGVFITGAVILSLYLAGSRSFATPAVVLVLLGGMMVPILPGGLAAVGKTVMFLGLVASILAVSERYFIRSNF